MNYLNQVLPECPAFLADVERALAERLWPGAAVAGTGAMLARAARQLGLAPGAKRVRPLLVEWVGTSLGAPPERLVSLAAATELIHTASLLHDDVVDEGVARRGLATANALFGNQAAVLSGDWVLARALQALLDYPLALTAYAVELVAEMSLGAVAEVELRGRPRLSAAEWEWLARRKCGLLFGFAARSAALVAGRPELASPLAEAFIALGVAFQKADDLRDVLDDASGKDRFADLRNQNPSWAIAGAVGADPGLADALEAAWSDPGVSGARWAELGQQLAARSGPLAAALEVELAGAIAAAGALLGPRASSQLGQLFALTLGPLPRKAVA